MWFTIAFVPLVEYNLGKKGNIISRIDVGKKRGLFPPACPIQIGCRQEGRQVGIAVVLF